MANITNIELLSTVTSPCFGGSKTILTYDVFTSDLDGDGRTYTNNYTIAARLRGQYDGMVCLAFDEATHTGANHTEDGDTNEYTLTDDAIGSYFEDFIEQ